MYKYLNILETPSDLRKLKREDLPILAEEARDFILDIVSTKTGHLGASLGVIELTIALHYYYNTPTDLLIWDVGHQAYGHKLFTGRKSDFQSLRQLNGMSGFPDRTESEFDAFGVGHSSTSISAITGMALANRLKNDKRKHLAVIGDASIVSGMAFEGLNHLGDTDLNVNIILNDNNIGIDPAVGALQNHFNNTSSASKVDFFEALGFNYIGPIDGHNFDELFKAFDELENLKGPNLLHIKTIKGKGYESAEKDQVLWHSPGKFDKKTGIISPKKEKLSYQKVVGDSLIELFKDNNQVAAITPAMPTGSGMVELMQLYPGRVWNVGIAEQHAVTLAAGLATQGITPYCVIYSTFLQRAYDQVIHDVALQNLPVVFLIDRAGFVGSDGATHHGLFDISFLNSIPNMAVACPADENELKELIEMGAHTSTPLAIRYPKGEVQSLNFPSQNTEIGKAKTLNKGEKTAILSTGHIASNIQKAIEGLDFSWYHFPFVKPLDLESLKNIFENYSHILTFENGIKNGGFGASILDIANSNNYKGQVEIHAYPDEFIAHGTIDELENLAGLDSISIRKRFEELI
ncbi:1-deoxy-D-xylulose-5-phosphate synthase [Weeksellaceae bacterium KMM 9713]|uniref:1-deoxy-D-xylulose-5-phosphate synthase n=1 Tax=Profundicola chukchiensis TaxID=2961959 RepID=A0A9X4MVJ7_9FLAO|nr:1-deoxy-D-xylulose-5-phosphate synthase [Profundicola chukchiensis]MDG4944853.1 1-deoxy-D-xylulose-5-phosphate synthase [Profundicola chukchiensis]